ncbi:hypothetical protein L2E82_32135 [Cichorium intybus]|uniref:Uncharacterized protein n=1 Tax=Cichorium intybus TaxID=13427 RepID=A0ACB9BFY3_CICIN|nr:hypothetical protein L2E82_32135 [Cichorium intybus]
MIVLTVGATSRESTLLLFYLFLALVVLLHGLNDHSGRYDEFAKQLNAHGYKEWIVLVSSSRHWQNIQKKKKNLLSLKCLETVTKHILNSGKTPCIVTSQVNSLFFDPLIHKIYDYSNGMKDLLELKLQTLVPANLSFTEDCARILRGLRIAARHGLSFSKDIETAIHKHVSSLLDLSKSRIMMEMDYMRSYGAAESSLRLLHKYHILDILLPFHASYISRQTSGSDQCSMMLMLSMTGSKAATKKHKHHKVSKKKSITPIEL